MRILIDDRKETISISQIDKDQMIMFGAAIRQTREAESDSIRESMSSVHIQVTPSIGRRQCTGEMRNLTGRQVLILRSILSIMAESLAECCNGRVADELARGIDSALLSHPGIGRASRS